MLYYIEQDSNTFNQYNEVMSVALVTNEQVIKALRNYNPWWRNPSAAKEEDRPQHRVAYHETLRIMQHKTIRRFAVLSGARRVGKTTILYQIINHLIDNGVNPRNIFYATFDNPVLKMAGVDMVLSAYDSMYPVEGVRYVFFDEIQYTENWELWMKVIYDSRKDIRPQVRQALLLRMRQPIAEQVVGQSLKFPRFPFMNTASFCSWMICRYCRTT